MTPKTAYVRIRGSYIEEEVTYLYGPVDVLKTVIDGYYTKTGFKPQAADMTGVPTSVLLGDGVQSTNSGPFVSYTSFTVDEPTIATPDEMLPGQALRDREYQMTHTLFYGEAEAGKVFTTAFGTDANRLNFSTAHGRFNGELVMVESAGTLPAGLLADTFYYIVNKGTLNVELAEEPGGTPITLTSNGTGVHKLIPFCIVGDYPKNLNPRFSNGRGRLIA